MSKRNSTRSSSLKDDNSKGNGKTKQGRNGDDGWGGFRNYMDAKKQKLNDQFQVDKQETGSTIFAGVRIYVNGYTKPSSDELRRIMQKHGGKYEMYLSKTRVTHIVATNLPNSKLHQAKTMPVVKPEWITESLTAGKLLPHGSYLLFDKRSKLQSDLGFLPTTSLTHTASSCASSSNTNESAYTSIKENTLLQKADTYDRPRMNEKDLDAEDEENGSEDIQLGHRLRGKTSEDKAKELPMGDNESVHSPSDEDEIIYNSDEEQNSSRKSFNLLNFCAQSSEKSTESFQARELNRPRLVGHKSQDDRDGLANPCDEEDSPLHHPETSSCLDAKEISKHPPVGLYDDSNERKAMSNNSGPHTETAGQETESKRDSEEENEDSSRVTKIMDKSSSPNKQNLPTSSSMGRAGDKDFLSEFYSNSRLHHLSTWGAEFKAYVAEIKKSNAGTFPGREKLRQVHEDTAIRLGMVETLETARHNPQERTVMHIDMDCFFVSVGLLARPDLRGKPVAVTHSRGQGPKPNAESDAAWERAEWHKKRNGELKTQSNVTAERQVYVDDLVPKGSTGTQTFHSMAELASCSYEARKKGVKNGMFMGKAKSLCPDLQTIPYNFAEYNRISRILYDTVASYTHDIEAVSCDEMLLDCTDLLSDTGSTALEFASLLRSEVEDKTGCAASVGIGPNILLARLATRKAKPNGQFQVLECDAKQFIKDQDVSDLPGVGYSMTRKLTKLGVKTCGDLQVIAVSRLKTEFGPKTGESLHRFSIGQDDREVKGDKKRKSVSVEVNYGIRFTKEYEAVKFLHELSNEVQQRMAKLKVKGHCITLKLMVRRPDAPQETAKFMGHGICNTYNKSTNLPVATNDGSLIAREVTAIYKSHNVSAADVRGIGIHVQKLEPETRTGYGSGKQLSGHQSILSFAVASNKDKTEISVNTSTSRPTVAMETISSPRLPQDSTKAPIKYAWLSKDISQAETSNRKDRSHMPSLHKEAMVNFSQSNARAMSNTPVRTTAAGGISLPSDQVDLNALTDVSFLLSPSQVNTEVLNELPEEIAKEIRADMEQHSRRISRPVSTSTPVTFQGQGPSPIAGPSGLHSVNQPGLSLVKQPGPSLQSPSSDHCDPLGERMDNDVITDLPSMSQVDFGCFQALPKHLQMELQAAYRQRKKPLDSEERRAALMGTALGRLKSPSKDKDKQAKPTKTGKRRGRPPGKKKLTFSHQIAKSSPVKAPAARHVVTHEEDDVIVLDDPEETTDHAASEEDTHSLPQQQEVDVRVRATEEPTICQAQMSTSVASFCGATTVPDIRRLLKEWLNSSQDPGEDDVAMVTDYLVSLITAGLMEQAYCHLRFLNRRVTSPPSLESWRESVDDITNQVQASVWDLYGSCLKLL